MRPFLFGLLCLLFLSVPMAAYAINSAQIGNHDYDPQVLSASTASAEATDPVGADSEILILINAARARYDLPALTESSINSSIAATRTSEIVMHASYSHMRANGTDFSSLYDVLPAKSCENLQLQSSESSEKAINAWLGSKSHKQCLLNPSLRYAGVESSPMIITATNGTKDKTEYYLYTFIGSSN